jgi:hypothetical protein
VCAREERVGVDVEGKKKEFGSQRLEFIDDSENAINQLARWLSIGRHNLDKLCKLL